MSSEQQQQQWSNRIVGYANVNTNILEPNILNWRLHPTEQESVLLDVLAEIGIVQNIVVNMTTLDFEPAELDDEGPDVTDIVRTDTSPPTIEHARLKGAHMVDGHLRLKLAMDHGQISLPVTLVNLTEEEETAVLATLDPIAGMATVDNERLRLIHERLNLEGEAIQTMLADIADKAGLYTQIFTPATSDAMFAANPYEDKEYHARKQVTVLYSLEDFATFTDTIHQLGDHYGSDSITETILLTLQDAAKTIPEPKVGPARERKPKPEKEKAKAAKPPLLEVPPVRGAKAAAPERDFFADESDSIPELV